MYSLRTTTATSSSRRRLSPYCGHITSPSSLSRQDLPPGCAVEDAIWEALAESYAVVAIIPEDAPASWMAFEAGAAKAWNKPVYGVAATATVPPAAATLQNVTILPASRVDEIAKLILESAEPISDGDRQRLGEAYSRIGVPVDQLPLQPQQLAKLVKLFNQHSGRQLSGEQIISLLLRFRKRGGLPSLGKRTRRNAT